MMDLQQAAARLVVKDGVRLGLLADTERDLALALAWAALPATGPWSERDLNAAVMARLADTLAFLDTDHVELRRWLVDGGWLQRDGYGREYRRVEALQLAEPMQPVARWAAERDVVPWVASQREAHRATRAARRQAWQASPP
jgi:Uncharacterized protein conserved in bacteria (DUF2087)